MKERENVHTIDVVKYRHPKASKLRGSTIGAITSSLILSGVVSHDAHALQVPPASDAFSHTLRLPQIANDGPPVRLIAGVEVPLSPDYRIITPDMTKLEDIPPAPLPPVPAAAQSDPESSSRTPFPHVEGAPEAWVWDKLAHCESTDRWNVNTGNGFYGGLQFDLPTWRSVGGTGLPSDASREEQIYRAQLLWKISEWTPWPHCSKDVTLNGLAPFSPKSATMLGHESRSSVSTLQKTNRINRGFKERISRRV